VSADHTGVEVKDVRQEGAGVAVAATVAVAGMLLATLTPHVTLGSDTAWTASAVSALGGLLAARRTAHGPVRAMWTWLSGAALSWLLAQLAWDLFSIIGMPSSPNPADVGWWGFALLVMAGLLLPAGRSGVRLVRLVEALPLIAAAMALTGAFLWSHAIDSPLPVAGRISAFVYPALYVSAAVVTLQGTFAGALRPARGGAGVTIVLLGIVCQAVGFILWSRQLLDGDYAVGHTVSDPLWAIGFLAIGIGGTSVARGPRLETIEAEPTDRAVLLPAAMFVLLIGSLLNAQLTSAALEARVVLTAGLTICGLTLIARGVLLARRQRSLLIAERRAREALLLREAELERLTTRLAEDARRDPLTGLRNRRALAEDLPVVEQQTLRRGGGYAIVLCDVDHFKAYNDALGHLAGDDALRAIATIVRGELRSGDVAYRYGGEELLVVLHDADPEMAGQAAERVRAAVTAARLPHPSGIGGVMTVSIGVAAGGGDGQALLARADAALYAAKQDGRNRVTVAGDQVSLPAPAATRTDRSVSAEPGIRRLQSLLAVSHAARTGEGPVPVLAALAQVIRSELRFATVVANLREGDTVRAAVVLGDQDARDLLVDTRSAWEEWQQLLRPERERCGAIWLPAGAHDWSEGMPAYVPNASARLGADTWRAEDALLLPLRDGDGEVLAIIAVDEPLDGRRPDDDAIEVLMAVADHGAAILGQLAHERAALEAAAAHGSAQQLAAVMLLAESLDLRDTGTALHSQTVAQFARDIAHELGLPADQVTRVSVAGTLHDLGKLAVPDAVLHKPGPLDDDEWREMRRHPETGARILAHAGLTDIAEWVHAHHERIDGRGYPRGLAGDGIPLEARILAVADAYEAMIADRPYRAGMSPDEAQEELRAHRGTQFDAPVVDAFLATLQSLVTAAV
jgi:diguanylate cyclase (GGDEF)-like protein